MRLVLSSARASSETPPAERHRTEHWADADLRCGQPRLQRLDRLRAVAARYRHHLPLPFLVGLAVSDQHAQSVRCLGQVGGLKRAKFTAAECTGEAERQQRTISLADQCEPRLGLRFCLRRRGAGGLTSSIRCAPDTRTMSSMKQRWTECVGVPWLGYVIHSLRRTNWYGLPIIQHGKRISNASTSGHRWSHRIQSLSPSKGRCGAASRHMGCCAR